MNFLAIRIDVDTLWGIKRGLPLILDALDDFGCKASFYVVMGPETGLDAVSSAFKSLAKKENISLPTQEKAAEENQEEKVPRGSRIVKTLKKYGTDGTLDLARSILFPKKSIAEAGSEELKKAIRKGHEVGLHGWKHFTWGKAESEVEGDFKLAYSQYYKLFGKKPLGFTSPMARWTPVLLHQLDMHGFVFGGDIALKNVDEPFHPVLDGHVFKHLQFLPPTVNPFNDNGTLFERKKKGGKPLLVYFHADGITKENVLALGKTLTCAKKAGFEVGTCEMLASHYANRAKKIDISRLRRRKDVF